MTIYIKDQRQADLEKNYPTAGRGGGRGDDTLRGGGVDSRGGGDDDLVGGWGGDNDTVTLDLGNGVILTSFRTRSV